MLTLTKLVALLGTCLGEKQESYGAALLKLLYGWHGRNEILDYLKVGGAW